MARPRNPGLPRPISRRLRVYAFDPAMAAQLETSAINEVTLDVPWEAGPGSNESSLQPGPVGEYIEVVDVDPASGMCYPPVDLDHPHLLAQDGLPPSEGSPQFHQQMVYAVAMSTVKSFERALGRCALWRGRPSGKREWPFGRYEQRLRMYPHALREANAYYSPGKISVLFGYFPASRERPGANLPGGTVFTCLSHEIIAHETAHALLDGMQQRFLDATNPDVHALHEALADIVALFQHFSYVDVLRSQIAATRGDLRQEHLLVKLAIQFGQAIGRRGALRDALGTVDADGAWHPKVARPDDLDKAVEPHVRGGILVAAVFDAFLNIYSSRIRDLLRVASGGTGVLPAGELHPDLVNRLAIEAAKSARHMLAISIRALDYCPPVDVSFGDYLRALITADCDVVPNDDRSYRIALIEAFRRRGIVPKGVRSLSEESVRWDDPAIAGKANKFRQLMKMLGKSSVGGQEGVIFRQIQPDWGLSSNRRRVFGQVNRIGSMLQAWLDNRLDLPAVAVLDRIDTALGLALTAAAPATITRAKRGLPAVSVQAIRPARRFGPDGESLVDLVIQLTQSRRAYFSEAVQRQEDSRTSGKARPPDFWFTGGCTLLVDLARDRIRYCVHKNIVSDDRLRDCRSFMSSGSMLSARAAELDRREPLAALHRSLGGV